jgi:LemA protein
VKKTLGCALVLIVLLVGIGLAVAGSYNKLVDLQEAVESTWGNVENAYQRRADLVPNLVATVKGAAEFEQETFTQVTEARARVGQVSVAGLPDAAQLEQFQQAQGELSSALSRLLVVVERYPDLTATQAFRDLQVQLEGTENRITVARHRFNEAAQAYNAARRRFPAVLIAGTFGFDERPYFEAQEGAETAPRVEF